MSVETKIELTAPYQYANDHERDALSAALDAYRQYRHKFQNLQKRIPPGHDLDEVRARVIRGQSLDSVLGEMHVPVPAPATEPPPVVTGEKHDERVRVLDGMVKRLRTYIADLEEGIKAKDYEIHRLQSRLRNHNAAREIGIAKDAEIVKRDATIQSLKKHLRKEERHGRNLAKRITRIKKFAELSMDGEVVPVKVMDALTKEGLRRLAEDSGLAEGDIVFVDPYRRVGEEYRQGSCRNPNQGGRDRGLYCSQDSDPQLLLAFREAGIPLLSG